MGLKKHNILRLRFAIVEAILEHLFKEGVMVVKNDPRACKHNELEDTPATTIRDHDLFVRVWGVEFVLAVCKNDFQGCIQVSCQRCVAGGAASVGRLHYQRTSSET